MPAPRRLKAAIVRQAGRVAVVAALLVMPGAFNQAFNQAFGQAVTPAHGAPDFSANEIQRILTLGPWPAPVRPDPSNRVSGQPLAIELGRRLFRDPRMSPVGYIACVTCHQPDRSFTDLKARAHGLADLPRNTPALLNLRQQTWFGWDGASDSLWMASIRPMLDSREFDSSPATVANLFARDPELAACYRKVFQASPSRDPQRTLVNVGKALAAYQETLVTARTPFDAFRDALAVPNGGGAPVRSTYPAAAQRGLKVFVGQGGCVACHQGPNFSDGRFHKVLVNEGNALIRPADRPNAGLADAPDTGRLAGAISVRHDPHNLAGVYNDSPERAAPRATQRLVPQDAMRGQFRTPGLRNVATTAPYLHDGRADRLHDAIRHGGHAAPSSGAPVTALPLSSQQADDLVTFLATLTDAYGQRRPWSSDVVTPCP